MTIEAPADYTAETYRSLAWSGLRGDPRFTTPWHRAGIYLLLRGTARRAFAHAMACGDDDAITLLYPLADDPMDLACEIEQHRIGVDRPSPRSGAFNYDRRREDHEPQTGRNKRRRIGAPLPLCEQKNPYLQDTTIIRSERNARMVAAMFRMAKRLGSFALLARRDGRTADAERHGRIASSTLRNAFVYLRKIEQ